jgi:acetoin utilization deacetylase AcuC-like enzyme
MRFAIVYSPEIKESNLAISRRLVGFERAIKRLEINYLYPELFEFKEEILYEIHSKEHVERVKRFFASQSAIKSAWSVYTAAKLLKDYDFVLVPTSGTGHAATKEKFRGYSFINDVNLAIKVLRDLGFQKISVLDTDAHHGVGILEYIVNDPNSTYFCFCGKTGRTADGKKLCFGFESEDEYIELIKNTLKSIEDFSAEVLIWYVGQDSHEDEISDVNISTHCFEKMAELMNEKIGRFKTLLILAGGSNEMVTEELTSAILKTLFR